MKKKMLLSQTPKAVTAEWIRKQKAPYFGVEAHFCELLKDASSGGQMKFVRRLPSGYYLVYLFWRFYTDVQNGGFLQFIGNASAVDQSQQVIVETVETLERVGMPELAISRRKAIAVMGSHLPRSVLSVLPNAERQKAAKRRPSDEKIQIGMDPMDHAFNQIDLSSFPKFDKYIKDHPEEFIHGEK